jgi:DNA-binding CsgD family transcriptional regulator/tetratricopeptide (TPR) repeat protein
VLTSPSAPILVGRERQLDVLHAFMGRVPTGSAGALVIRGDAGAGKTRLVGELQAGAHETPIRVLVGGCVALGEEPLRHASLIELLRNAQRRDIAGAGAGDEHLAGLATEQMLERLLALVDQVETDAPVVLVFEDLHWADRGTCEILTVLTRHVADRPVGLVLTCREEMRRDHPVRGFLSELLRNDTVTPVAVPPLTTAEVARLVEVLRGDADARVVAQVFERSAGNPLIIEELCARGDDASTAGEGPVRDILLARFWQLSADARELVRAVAVARAAVEQPMLSEVLAPDLDAKAFALALREAVDLRVLAMHDDVVTMRHVLMAEAVYDEMLAVERVEMHRRWAETLSDAPAALVAHHWYEAGEHERAFDASLAAAREATGALAFDAAHRHYIQVLSLYNRIADAPARAGAARWEIVLQTAETANWAGVPSAGVAVIDAALETPAIRADPATTSVLLERRAWFLLRQGANDEARTAYDAALAVLPADADPSTRARVLAGSVRAWERAGDFARARALAEEAVAVAVAAGIEAEVGPAHYMLGRILLGTGDLDAGIAEISAASDAAEHALNPVLLAISLLEKGDALARRGQLADAVGDALAAAARLRARGETEPHGLLATAAAAAILHRLGRVTEGRAHATVILEEARNRTILAVGHLLAGAFDVEQLALGAARDHLETARILAAPLLDGRVGASLANARADLAFAEGNLEAAASAVDEGISKVANTGDDEALAHLCLAGLRVEVEREQLALGRGSTRARTRRDRAIDGYEAHLQRVLAPLARGHTTAADRPDLAAIGLAWAAELAQLDGVADATMWRAAADAWTTAQWPRHAAYAERRHAEALARAKAPTDSVTAAFACARDAANAVESAALVAPVLRVAQDAGVALADAPVSGSGEAAEATRPAPAPAAALAELTPREREVLELVIAGATNRQIAQRLFISEKTASVHVSRILTKLGVSSRQEAAAEGRRALRTGYQAG